MVVTAGPLSLRQKGREEGNRQLGKRCISSSGRGCHPLLNFHHCHHLPPQPKFKSFLNRLNVDVSRKEVGEQLNGYRLLCKFESQLSKKV